jgi:hypothetical protein
MLENTLTHYLDKRNEVIDNLIKLLIITKQHSGNVIGNPDFNALGMLNHIIEYDNKAGDVAALIELSKLNSCR